MASASNTTGVIHSSGKMLVSLNAASQFPLKLTRENYPAWRAQIVPVLRGHNLMGYVDGSFPCPSQGVQKEGKERLQRRHGITSNHRVLIGMPREYCRFVRSLLI
ncbi:uncharacterized protein LOC110625330 [Manihot esculenta]|uniref:uncharacterized protein LOC110625330 n=1 Tax=Manihot esculenta TaxID=3983 RepID=UPI001CC79D86|nr:uncharacterized protein LOC110625330 [Manihot esculenta]